MTWRRFHLILFAVMVAIFLLRLATGNLIGAIIPLILAGFFGSVAFDYPVLSKLRRLWWVARRVLRRGSRS